MLRMMQCMLLHSGLAVLRSWSPVWLSFVRCATPLPGLDRRPTLLSVAHRAGHGCRWLSILSDWNAETDLARHTQSERPGCNF